MDMDSRGGVGIRQHEGQKVMDILEKLEKMAVLPQGSEMPEWLSADPFLSWDVPLRKLFYDAAEEIRTLRADVVVTRNMSGFREIKQGIKDGTSVS